MKKLRTIAKVYDTTKMEYVQRYTEVSVSDEVVKGIQDAINPEGATCCPIRSGGHGTSGTSLSLNTPLRNQKRFHLDAQLQLIDVNEETGEETIIGGWSGM